MSIVDYSASMRKRLVRCGGLLAFILAQAACGLALAQVTLEKSTVSLESGGVQQLQLKTGDPASIRWVSSDPLIAAVYGKGYVCAIHPGVAKISAGGGAGRAT